MSPTHHGVPSCASSPSAVPVPMSKRNTFQSVYRDVEDGRFPSDRTYKPSQHPLRSLLYRPKSQILTVITLFLLTFLLTRGHYAGKVKGLEERIEGMKKGGHGVAGEKQETFAIVTFETRDVTYWRESLGNKYLYAQRHGYAFHPYFQELPHDDVGRVWSKIPLVNHTFSLGDPDWVLWMDFDTLFTNMSFTFEEFVKDVKENYVNLHNTGQKWIDVDMILTADCGDFNAGIILFRNSAWSRHFLEETWQKRHDDTGSEQDAMKKLLQKANEFEEGNKHMIRVPQWKLNSYPEEISCKEDMKRPWRVGDWIIHFPGAWAVLRDSKDPFGDLLRRYYPKIVD